MVFNLSTVIDWKAIMARKPAQVDRDNLHDFYTLYHSPTLTPPPHNQA